MSKRLFISARDNRRAACSGFTLLEMLVATAVLALMLVMFVQITGYSMNATQLSHRQLDVAMQARNVFDKISGHLDSVMNCPGAPPKVFKNAGNDELYFLADSRPSTGWYDSSTNSVYEPRFAVVGYKVPPTNDTNFCLTASGTTSATGTNTTKPLMLNCGTHYVSYRYPDPADAQVGALDANGVYWGELLQALNAPSISSAPSRSLEYQALSPNIFRFELSFLRNDGKIVAIPPDDVSSYAAPSGIPAAVHFAAFSKQGATPPCNRDPSTTTNQNGFYVKAVIVGLAGFSGEVRRIVGGTNGTKIGSLITALPDSADGQAPLETWDYINNASVRASVSGATNQPQLVLNNLRVYQRYFYVNN